MAEKKTYAPVIIAVLLLLILGAGVCWYLLPPPEYRVAILPETVDRSSKAAVLNFRYQWHSDMIREAHSAYACICFRDTTPPLQAVVICPGDVPTADAQCKASLKVARLGDDYQPYRNARRFPLPSEQAHYIQELFVEGRHKFEMGLMPDAQGALAPHQLYVDGVTLEKFIKQNAVKAP